ncbi:putative inactive leucine-rich repeat receptor protein kinase [Trifolium repens]|nr:putative inactive leucine-rich repeat receptor protein kinase [Trifolium repens]
MHKLLHPQLVVKGSKEISILMERLTSTIWLEELRDATNCFSLDNAIGAGKMGMMYQGFLPKGKERLLAYAYMSNGRLSKWLHPLESEVIRLKWHDRINIALGIARSLAWLPHTCDLGIVYFNICSQCILLDDNFEPKISNFGEAKFMNANIEDHLGVIFKVNDEKKDVFDF